MLHAVLLALAPVPAPLLAPPSAGPPAICFPLDVGDTRTPPWGSEDPLDTDPSFSQGQLVGEVMAVLAESDEALVHAETLRRAVIYVTTGARKAKGLDARTLRLELVQALQMRALEAELDAAEGSIEAHVRALCWLDVGYALGAFEQMGDARIAPALPALERAHELAAEDGGVALAAWLAAWTRDASGPRRDALLAAAVRLADDPDGLVRANLMSVARPFLGIETYDQLAAKVGASKRRDG